MVISNEWQDEHEYAGLTSPRRFFGGLRARSRDVPRFLRFTSGAATIEYAFLIAVICAGAFVAVELFGTAIRNTLSQVPSRELVLNRPDLPATERNEPASVTHTPSAVLRWKLTEPWRFTVLAMMLTACVTCTYLYLRRSATITPSNRPDDEQDIVSELNHSAIYEKRQQILRIISDDMRALLENRLEARHLMTRQLAQVPGSTSSELVRELIETSRVRHLLVCDGDRLVGIISDRDLARTKATTASAMMTPDPIVITHDTPVAAAVTMMINRHISCLPVMKHNQLCGVLTTTDLIMTLQCTLRILHQVAVEVSASAATHPAVAAVSSETSAPLSLAGRS